MSQRSTHILISSFQSTMFTLPFISGSMGVIISQSTMIACNERWSTSEICVQSQHILASTKMRTIPREIETVML